MRPIQLLMFGLAFQALLGACGHIKMVPDNATAFQEGLRCNMTHAEVDAWATTNGIDGTVCRSPTHCETGTGRAVYTLRFNENDQLTSVQSGYIYDLTYLTYDPVIDLCA